MMKHRNMALFAQIVQLGPVKIANRSEKTQINRVCFAEKKATNLQKLIFIANYCLITLK